MKGENILVINTETLVEALQEYFDKRLVLKPVVKSLRITAMPTVGVFDENTKLHVGIQDNGSFLKGSND